MTRLILLSHLIGAQANSTWEDDILNTAFAYHAIKATGATPTHELKTLEYFENEQENNGSFNNIYKTTKVLKRSRFPQKVDSSLLMILCPRTRSRQGLLPNLIF